MGREHRQVSGAGILREGCVLDGAAGSGGESGRSFSGRHGWRSHYGQSEHAGKQRLSQIPELQKRRPDARLDRPGLGSGFSAAGGVAFPAGGVWGPADSGAAAGWEVPAAGGTGLDSGAACG